MIQLSHMKQLSNLQLRVETKKASDEEKNTTLKLLEHLAEVEDRLAYAEYGFSSLWKYVSEELGYSDSQTSERVLAMRLLKKVPESKEALKDGRLNLTIMTKVAYAAKREDSSIPEVKDLLEKCEGKSTREVDRLLATNEELRPQRDIVRPISQQLTRLTLEVDEDFMALLVRAKELQSNPGKEYKEVIREVLQKFIEKKDGPLKKFYKRDQQSEENRVGNQNQNENETETSPPNESRLKAISSKNSQSEPNMKEPKILAPRYIRVHVELAVRTRSGNQCEYLDSLSGKRCSERHGLEFDHYYTPHAMGGANSADNLRHHCRTHNLLRAREVYGELKMRNYARAK